MSPSRILFADNDPYFRKARTEFLYANYHVLEAGTVQEAEQCLQDEWIHLAILDIRLMDDRDDRDVSGLFLAKNEAFRSVPKIMLTGFPTYEAVREALGPVLEGLPPAVDFLAKKEGPEAMLQAVEAAFAKHVRINRDLVVQLNKRNPITFPYLVTLIEPGLGDERLLHRTEELEDLFRRLFYEKSQISIDRLLWQREGRVALTIFAFQEGTVPESFVVVCGQNARVVEEARHYREFAPKVLGDTGTILSMQAETRHLAANAYVLTRADLENVHMLTELYRTGPEKSFNTAVDNFLQQTLTAWHQEKRIREDTKTLDELYRERLVWTEEHITRIVFDERVAALVRQIPTLGPQIERGSGKLTIRFHGRSFSYADPTPAFYQGFDIGQPVLLINTPGTLGGDSILTDSSSQTWLTDFADAGLAPLLWNFVTMEATIRFDWAETNSLQSLHEMEQCLMGSAFSKLDTRDIERPLRKPVRAIMAVRRFASRMIDRDPLPYHLGMLFHAVSRLMDFNPALRLTANELMRLAHILIAAAMICSKIGQAKQDVAAEAASVVPGIRIDQANRAVWVDGMRVSLFGQSYDLLCDLYEHANQLRTRREIVEQVFRQQYDETDESQISRLNTATRRLRERIEDEPGHPRYLLTEPTGGYRLVPQPKE